MSPPSADRRRSWVSAVLAVPRRLLAAVLLGLLWFYRHAISPWTPRTCRFYPSCSAYAEQAVRTHGPVRGSWLALRRLARCHPWTPGGVDHVPPARGERAPQGSVSTSASPSPSTSPSTGA
jgi:putative membrane protein insertion efficiency factor